MNQRTLLLLAGALAMLSACGGRSDPVTVVVPPVTEAVPAEAATSPAAATQYVAELATVAETRTDGLEPIATLPDSLAVDDSAEPKTVD